MLGSLAGLQVHGLGADITIELASIVRDEEPVGGPGVDTLHFKIAPSYGPAFRKACMDLTCLALRANGYEATGTVLEVHDDFVRMRCSAGSRTARIPSA